MPTKPAARQRRQRIQLNGMRTTRGALGYVRVSTNERTQLSLPDQRALVQRAAEIAGYEIIGWYEDQTSRGVRRQGLVDCLQEMEDNPEVGAIFFWQPSRLWGHIEQARRIMYRAQLAGVSLLDSKNHPYRDDTPMETLFNLIQSGVNEFEVKQTAGRIHDTHMEKFKAGKFVQRPPFGVKAIRTMNEDGSVVTSFAVDDAEMAVVRRMFKLYSEGAAGWKVAKILSEDEEAMKVKPSGYTAANVRRSLDNEFYIGKMSWNRTKTLWEIDDATGDKIKRIGYNNADEIVTMNSPLGCILAEDSEDPDSCAEALALWARCQQWRQTPGRERPKREYENRVLDGLVICGRCGYRMQARKFGNKLKKNGKDILGSDNKPLRSRNFDYRCQHATNGNKGCSKSHTMAENKIWKALEQYILEESPEGGVVSFRPAKKSARATKEAKRRIELAIEAAEKELQRVTSGLRKGAYEDPITGEDDIDLYKSERAEAARNLQEAKRQLEEHDESDVELDAGLTKMQRDALANLIPQLRDEAIDIDIRRAMASKLFVEVKINNPSIEVTFAPAGA